MKNKVKIAILSVMSILSIGAMTSCNKIESNSGTEVTTTYTITFNTNGGSSVDSIKVNAGAKATKPADPTKDGFVFKGWYSNSGLTISFDFTNAINENITLYAKWEEATTPVTTYTVTFNSNGGTAVLSQTVNSGSKVSKPTNPTKEGYTFNGWFKNEALTEAYDFNLDVTSTFTLYAKWEEATTPVTTYTVTFNSNGGTEVLSQTVNAGASITEPADPTKNGYVFDCWCTDEALNNEFDVNSKINSNTVLYARWIEDKTTDSISITKTTAGNESAVVEFAYNDDFKDSDFVAYYSTDKTNYTQIDSELISYDNNKGVIYLVGLKADNYFVKVKVDGKADNVISPAIQVSEQDRSGYAHFGYNEGIGAYNNDGTLKTGAVVVYVNDDNKNTVTAEIGGKTYTGLANILKAATTGTPVDVRIIGTINAATWKPLSVSKYSAASANTIQGANGSYLELKNYDEADIISGGFNELDTSKYSKLNGLSNKIKYDSSKKEFDSYYNMLDISNAKNVTVEGIGEDAGLFQWGFTWKSCTSIEVKNLTFDDYTEDACSFEGGDDSETLAGFKTGHLWIHNNTFEKGVNYWDVCSEQDKHDGDGATDFKKLAYVTVSYNHYIENHKTGLVGGSDTQHTACLTFHHNFYDQCQSRLPFARQANMHMYNNYYYNSTGNNMQIYAGAFAFIENCYFKNTKNTFTLKTSDGKVAAVKSFNNIYDSCSSSGATIVSSRTDTVTNGNLYGQSFDTDLSIFYYDSTNQKSKVSILNDVEDVPTFTVAHAGAGSAYYNSLELGVIVGTQFEVTFKKVIDGSESTISTSLVLEGSTTTKPSNPKLSGYKFVGWYTDNTFTTEFNFSNPITTNTSIYAKFEEVETYTLTYKYNIGAEDVLIDTETYDEGELTVKPTDPTLNGYEFVDWYTDKTYTTEFTFGSALTDNATIYAKFDEQKITTIFINFNDVEIG